MKPQQEIYTPERRRALVAELVRRVSVVPGVQSAGIAENGPLGSRGASNTVESLSGKALTAQLDWITPGFFETVGMPMIAGRDFGNSDLSGAPTVIVNQ